MNELEFQHNPKEDIPYKPVFEIVVVSCGLARNSFRNQQ